MIPLPALLAEIRAAGEPPATIGPRLSPEHIKHILRSGVYVGGGWAPAADCAIRQLRADLARLAAEVERRQWQPIETAPKDGTLVLLWNEDGNKNPYLARFVRHSWHNDHYGAREPVWFYSHPTRWMPIPEPPDGH